MPWKTWVIDSDAHEIVGPCGHRMPFTFEGLKEAQEHECEESEDA